MTLDIDTVTAVVIGAAWLLGIFLGIKIERHDHRARVLKGKETCP